MTTEATVAGAVHFLKAPGFSRWSERRAAVRHGADRAMVRRERTGPNRPAAPIGHVLGPVTRYGAAGVTLWLLFAVSALNGPLTSVW